MADAFVAGVNAGIANAKERVSQSIAIAQLMQAMMQVQADIQLKKMQFRMELEKAQIQEEGALKRTLLQIGSEEKQTAMREEGANLRQYLQNEWDREKTYITEENANWRKEREIYSNILIAQGHDVNAMNIAKLKEAGDNARANAKNYQEFVENRLEAEWSLSDAKALADIYFGTIQGDPAAAKAMQQVGGIPSPKTQRENRKEQREVAKLELDYRRDEREERHLRLDEILRPAQYSLDAQRLEVERQTALVGQYTAIGKAQETLEEQLFGEDAVTRLTGREGPYKGKPTEAQAALDTARQNIQQIRALTDDAIKNPGNAKANSQAILELYAENRQLGVLSPEDQQSLFTMDALQDSYMTRIIRGVRDNYINMRGGVVNGPAFYGTLQGQSPEIARAMTNIAGRAELDPAIVSALSVDFRDMDVILDQLEARQPAETPESWASYIYHGPERIVNSLAGGLWHGIERQTAATQLQQDFGTVLQVAWREANGKPIPEAVWNSYVSGENSDWNNQRAMLESLANAGSPLAGSVAQTWDKNEAGIVNFVIGNSYSRENVFNDGDLGVGGDILLFISGERIAAGALGWAGKTLVRRFGERAVNAAGQRVFGAMANKIYSEGSQEVLNTYFPTLSRGTQEFFAPFTSKVGSVRTASNGLPRLTISPAEAANPGLNQIAPRQFKPSAIPRPNFTPGEAPYSSAPYSQGEILAPGARNVGANGLSVEQMGSLNPIQMQAGGNIGPQPFNPRTAGAPPLPSFGGPLKMELKAPTPGAVPPPMPGGPPIAPPSAVGTYNPLTRPAAPAAPGRAPTLSVAERQAAGRIANMRDLSGRFPLNEAKLNAPATSVPNYGAGTVEPRVQRMPGQAPSGAAPALEAVPRVYPNIKDTSVPTLPGTGGVDAELSYPSMRRVRKPSWTPEVEPTVPSPNNISMLAKDSPEMFLPELGPRVSQADVISEAARNAAARGGVHNEITNFSAGQKVRVGTGSNAEVYEIVGPAGKKKGYFEVKDAAGDVYNVKADKLKLVDVDPEIAAKASTPEVAAGIREGAQQVAAKETGIDVPAAAAEQASAEAQKRQMLQLRENIRTASKNLPDFKSPGDVMKWMKELGVPDEVIGRVQAQENRLIDQGMGINPRIEKAKAAARINIQEFLKGLDELIPSDAIPRKVRPARGR